MKPDEVAPKWITCITQDKCSTLHWKGCWIFRAILHLRKYEVDLGFEEVRKLSSAKKTYNIVNYTELLYLAIHERLYTYNINYIYCIYIYF